MYLTLYLTSSQQIRAVPLDDLHDGLEIIYSFFKSLFPYTLFCARETEPANSSNVCSSFAARLKLFSPIFKLIKLVIRTSPVVLRWKIRYVCRLTVLIYALAWVSQTVLELVPSSRCGPSYFYIGRKQLEQIDTLIDVVPTGTTEAMFR